MLQTRGKSDDEARAQLVATQAGRPGTNPYQGGGNKAGAMPFHAPTCRQATLGNQRRFDLAHEPKGPCATRHTLITH